MGDGSEVMIHFERFDLGQYNLNLRADGSGIGGSSSGGGMGYGLEFSLGSGKREELRNGGGRSYQLQDATSDLATITILTLNLHDPS